MKPIFWVVFPLFAGLTLCAPAAAQAPKPIAEVYEANDVTPCSFDVLTAAELIQSRAVYPADFLKTNPYGEVVVSFVVVASGKTREAKVVEALGSGCDEAAVAAVRQLPVIKPGKQNGCPVAVAYTVPVSCNP